MEKRKSEFKPLREIILNYSCMIFSLITTLYLFRDINATAQLMSFETGLILIILEFFVFGLMGIFLIDAFKSLFYKGVKNGKKKKK